MMRLAHLMAVWLLAIGVGVEGLAATSVTIHPVSAMVRIGGTGGAALPLPADRFTIDMVRGESEGLQFAILPTGSGPAGVVLSVHVPDRPAPRAQLYRVVAINHSAPPSTGMFMVPPRRLGMVPDVLMPLGRQAVRALAIRPGPGQPPLTFYLEFRAGRDVQPGVYPYPVSIEVAGATASLLVSVQVYEVLLPVRLPFRTAVCWNWSLDGYYGRALTDAEKRVFWNFCLDYRLSPCAFFSRMPDPDPSHLAELVDRGLSLVCLTQVSGRKPRPLSEQARARYAPLLRQWRGQLKELDMLNDAVVLLADEPPDSSIDVCRDNAAFFKEHFPEVKIWVATRPSSDWAEFTDVFDVVTAHSTDIYKHHSHEAEAVRLWRGAKPYPAGEYWWFHSVEPYSPYVNVRLDNLPIEARICGWQSALYGVDGYEYFWIADWSGNVDSRQVPWPKRGDVWNSGMSGAGTLCYPDPKMNPMPSLRLVNLRDGLEDWALIEMLGLSRSHPARRRITAPVTSDLATFTTDPEVLLRARRAVVEALGVVQDRNRKP